jgi:NitT/TauT family transport system ATP-binding protein
VARTADVTLARTGLDRRGLGSDDTHGIFIRRLGKSFISRRNEVHALRGIDLTVRQGEFLCIVGPSGCGKTTLLRILGGLEKPSEGDLDFRIEHGDDPLQSMVFQEQGVFPWLTVLQNTSFGLTVRGIPRAEREATARGYLRQLGLADFEGYFPRQLSGGMRQRVNLARAFANNPAVLLMDEPLSALDEQTKMLVQEDLLRLWEGSKKTVIFITHSLDEAIVLGDRVAVMSHRPGRIKAIFDIDLARPRRALELRNDPAFVAVRGRVWDSLREEVLSSAAIDRPDAR